PVSLDDDVERLLGVLLDRAEERVLDVRLQRAEGARPEARRTAVRRARARSRARGSGERHRKRSNDRAGPTATASPESIRPGLAARAPTPKSVRARILRTIRSVKPHLPFSLLPCPDASMHPEPQYT